MTQLRPFRFGVQARSARDRTAWTELARRTEAGGYSVLTMPEHPNDQFAAVPGLMSAADATTTLRLGQLVLTNDFKHPVVLAKELATLDVLSEGRLEIGLGAGHVREEYDQVGMPFDDRRTRVDRLFESITVIRGLMAEESLTFHGKHYTIEGLDGFPKPVQARPPLLVGGGGRRILSFAARHADIVGVNGTTGLGSQSPDWTDTTQSTPPGGHELIGTMTAEAVDAKVALIREVAGDRFTDLELNIRAYMTNVVDDIADGIDTMSRRLHVSESFLKTSPFALIGPPSKLIEDLLSYRERWGISYVVVSADDLDTFAPVVAKLA
ncbi:putative F420-dependent oxidoreductase [Rhodococcus sp. 27YEA15]|uniref:TIGR03621 family F420-dependent LLM class oxidoreductase n=1 Tax=Rhodococcus sp. 27YEA15 TaxID=3156259 RepID=UPI003C79B442